MAEERLRVKTAVYVIITHGGKIFTVQRKNSGYYDGFYTLPAGHIKQGEKPLAACVREAKEEANLNISGEVLNLVHVMFEMDAYIDFYFRVDATTNNLSLENLKTHYEVAWLDPIADADKIVPKARQALEAISAGKIYSEIDTTEGNKN